MPFNLPAKLATSEWHLVDPGDAGALPNSLYGVVPIVTTGAETRTLAQPSRAGLRLIVNMITDGGDCVVTVASPGYDVYGSTTFTLSAIGHYIELIAVDRATSTPVWRVVNYDGVTGPRFALSNLNVSALYATTLNVDSTALFESTISCDSLSAAGITSTGNVTISGAKKLYANNSDGYFNGLTSGSFYCDGSVTIIDDVTITCPDFTVTADTAMTGTLSVSSTTSLATLTTSGAATLASCSVSGDLTMSDGGTVTQLTSTVTGVTLNTRSGKITTYPSTLAAAGEETFTLTNSTIAAVSNVIVNVTNNTNTQGTPNAFASEIAAGSCNITVTNQNATLPLDGTLDINFIVLQGATS